MSRRLSLPERSGECTVVAAGPEARVDTLRRRARSARTSADQRARRDLQRQRQPPAACLRSRTWLATSRAPPADDRAEQHGARTAGRRSARRAAADHNDSQSPIDSAVQNDHSTQMNAEHAVGLAAVSTRRARATTRRFRRGCRLPAVACISYSALTTTSTPRIAQNSTSCQVRTARAAQPEPLIGVQQPGERRTRTASPRPAPRSSRAACSRKYSRVVEDLHHEVLPVDVDPAPEVGEARREEVVVVRLGQVEAEQVQHARR